VHVKKFWILKIFFFDFGTFFIFRFFFILKIIY
jgi:hypothetical protein